MIMRPHVRVGIFLEFISSMAKGNVALAVSLTAISTLAAIFLLPLILPFGNMYIHFYNAHSAAGLVRPLEI